MQKNCQEISQIMAAAELETTQMNLGRHHATNIMDRSQVGAILGALGPYEPGTENLQMAAGDADAATALGASAFGAPLQEQALRFGADNAMSQLGLTAQIELDRNAAISGIMVPPEEAGLTGMTGLENLLASQNTSLNQPS